MRFMRDQDNAYRPLRSALIVAGVLSLSACGGGSSSSNNAGQLSASDGQNFTVQSAKTATYGVNASDSAGKSLTYSIKIPPKMGTAIVNPDGTITYTAQNAVGSDSMIVTVSNGVYAKDVEIEIALQNDPVFDYQFYKVTNADTGNSQIVRYDPNDTNADSNQLVVKKNVILGNQVFMMSGAKDDDAIAYTKREYAIFLDPNGASETRTISGDSPAEYTFYKDNILKRFNADNPANETVIFQSSLLTSEMKSAGVGVIGSTVKTYLNEVDIGNSYVELKAFNDVPDLMKGEVEATKVALPITVRLSDSKVAAGRMIQPIVGADGTTQKVVLNYISASTGDGYEAAEKKLQVCEVDLSGCNDLSNGTGAYHYLTQNSGSIYMAKEGESTLYALDKSALTLAQVAGAEYPAEYDVDHHQISFGGGHGGAGIFSNFYNMANTITQLAENDTSYLLINYNLDTQDAVGSGMFAGDEPDVYIAKNAMLLKLTGNSGIKVYDNGSGTDLMNQSDAQTIEYNLSLTAVKNGQVFVESAKFFSEGGNFNYQQGWIDTDATEMATSLTNVVVDQTISYFTSIRVPAVAVGDSVYVNETKPLMGPERTYNIYKMPLEDSSVTKPEEADAIGRMYFERSAYRANGVYEGNVLLWHKSSGDLLNATTNQLMGNIFEDIDSDLTNVTADRSGNRTLAGVGGLFGLHMTTSHGEAPFLTSGSSDTDNSLKNVNQIDGEWITD